MEESEKLIKLLNVDDYPEELKQYIQKINERLKEAQLREEMLAKGFDAGMYIARFDEEENMISFELTEGIRKLFGYDGKEDLPDEFNSWIKLLVPEERALILKTFQENVKRHRNLPEISYGEYRMMKKDGSIIWVSGAGRFVQREDGSLKIYMGCCRDITAEYEKLEYMRVMSSTGFGMWHIYIKEGFLPRLKANEKMDELLGIKAKNISEEERYRIWYDRIVPESIPLIEENSDKMMSGHFSENTYKWNHPEKGIIYVRSGGTAEKLYDGTIVFSGYHGDVTEIIIEEQQRKAEIELLKKSVYIDDLTGANNRKAIDRFLDDCIKTGHEGFHVAMMDVDKFKEINDTYGHQAGDNALKLLAKAFMKNQTEMTFFARYGGDEFVLVSMSEKTGRIKKIVEKAEITLREMCLSEGNEYSIAFSCGIVKKTEEMETVSDILKAADAKMYEIKKGKSTR